MHKVELLSPAKDFETAIAAINSGADAIYIGASYFGARVNASNTLETIENIVNYAHKFYVRVHVTINTILNNDELEKAVKLVKNLYNIGVDAIIVQDMGLIKAAIDEKIPPIQIHASTQCDNRFLEKVKFFDKMGISRVILARELSLKEIKTICDNTNCEIETFIHGALCVSYSGQCYMSYANGGRSANRGECAQPCRKLYSLVDEDGKILLKNKYLLSLKDFNASENIKALIDAGVKSFKIEGRLKDKNYVQNITLFYNNLISKYATKTSSGKVFTNIEPDANKTFNRLYTDYFLNSRNDCYNFITPKSVGEYIGTVTKVNKNNLQIKTDKMLKPQDGICYSINECFEGFKVNKVSGDIIYPNNMPEIIAGTKLYRNYNVEFDKILTNSKIKRKIGVKFTVNNDVIIAEDEDMNIVSENYTTEDISKNPQMMIKNVNKQLQKTGDSDFYCISIENNFDGKGFLPVAKINELRRVLLQNLMSERLKKYRRLVQKPICYTNFPNNKLDYHANVLNDEAEKFYQNSNSEVIERAVESKIVVKSGIELMRCKHCLRFAAGLCSKKVKYNKKLYLLSQDGKKYPLLFDCKKCEMVVINP